jgi:DNA-binding transcriptional regulator YiaG
MPNIGAVLKQEIQRLAARVSRSMGESTRRTVTAQRKQIAALRAQIAVLNKQVASLQKGAKAATKVTAAPARPAEAVRPMRASAIRALRTRLGITASQLGKLVGVTDQSIYNWEHEKAKPKAAQAAVLAELKGLGKRQVHERLQK